MTWSDGAGEGDRYARWDAAYVFGSLASAERREYEAHLAGCDRCRAAVTELSGMPALLGLLDADDVAGLDDDSPEPPPLRPEVLASLLSTVRSRRRRAHRLTAAGMGVAAVLLAVGVVIAVRPGIVGLRSGTTETVAQLEMSTRAPTPFSATVALNDFGWGTRIDMACTYGDWGGGGDHATPSNLGMVVVGRDGSRTQVATWLGLSGATALPSGNTPMPKERIAAVQLVSVPSSKVLLERRV